ncbi:MAG: IS1 family transposase [Acidobacteria bacterium]|nr:IS1 family transposase [Acidobacteriota bacterium]
MRIQRYLCKQCGKRFSEPQNKPLGDVRLPMEKVRLILHCLVEGNSVRGTARLCGVEKRTVLNLLKAAGEHCERLLERRLRGAPVKDLQLDEVWTFVFKKEQNKWLSEAGNQRIGDAYTFIALERESKLIVAWHLGKRTAKSTEAFIAKLRTATAETCFQITTDGFTPYPPAIENTFGSDVDYAQLVKIYGQPEEGRERYSPAEVINAVPTPVLGSPDRERICTSHVERQNGTLRQWCKRLTRLTYAFSKKWENLQAALALHFAYYNCCRIQGRLRVTPAMEAGITDHVWNLNELLAA